VSREERFAPGGCGLVVTGESEAAQAHERPVVGPLVLGPLGQQLTQQGSSARVVAIDESVPGAALLVRPLGTGEDCSNEE
jgi:hypothetical protein